MCSKERMNKFHVLENMIGYKFRDVSLLCKALTHSSYANEHGLESNERLEFLGDSVLGLTISDHLFRRYPDLPEGDLTKMRSIIVSEHSLALVARDIMLGDYLLLGRGEDRTGGRKRESILADGVEAVIGAIYIDGDFYKSANVVLGLLKGQISAVTKGTAMRDYKTELQEYVQSQSKNGIEYALMEERGPDHAKLFIVNAFHEGTFLGRGRGRSKKEAEQNAARTALKFLLNGE